MTTSEPRGLPRRAVLAALAGALLSLITVVGFLGYQRATQSTVETNREQVVVVASAQAVAMLAYSAQTVDDELRSAADGLTDDFAAEYLELLDAVVIPDARAAGTATEVAVVGAAATEVGSATASVLLFLNQTTTTTASPEPVVSGSRVTVTLEKVDGHWLVADLTPI